MKYKPDIKQQSSFPHLKILKKDDPMEAYNKRGVILQDPTIITIM